MQRRGQKFFEEYIPLDVVFESVFAPDFAHVYQNPFGPDLEIEFPDPKRVLVYEGLHLATRTPVGRGLLIGAYALSYIPLLEKTRTSKTYGPSELMLIQSGVGGGLIV